MPSYVPPKRGTAWVGYTALVDAADTKLLKAGPTLAEGDVKISKDGGAFANLATLPDAEPNASAAVRIQLSATEMTADNVVILFVDQTVGPEWCSQCITLQTSAGTIDEQDEVPQ